MHRVFEDAFKLMYMCNLRELAPPLTPEDPSREAYWVANGNWRRAVTRQLGRL